jgi:hypothetical protein
MSRLSDAERRIRAQVAAHSRLARERPDEITLAARQGLLARFERDADPDGTLPERERRRRAWHLYQAHLYRMQLAGLRARRLAAEAAVAREVTDVAD